MKRIISAVVILIGLAAPAWAGFAEGFAAYERGDYATALREWRPLAGQGISEAQSNLGVMYQRGQGVPQDYAKAVRWYSKAANQGVPRAQFNLGFMYQNGLGVPQDTAKAVRWYGMAANQGLAIAQTNLDLIAEVEAQRLARAQRSGAQVATSTPPAPDPALVRQRIVRAQRAGFDEDLAAYNRGDYGRRQTASVQGEGGVILARLQKAKPRQPAVVSPPRVGASRP